jgi:signal-transduction protein with cAMP-binding, CBS, and nucleotidyltransferase domain
MRRVEMKPIEIIRECKIFKMFPESLMDEIASIGFEATYKKNEILFNIDEPAHNLGILMRGRLDIMATKRTQLIPIHTVYPGEAFALSSMITGLFVAAAKAVEDSVVFSLPAEKLHRILEKDYKAGYLFMKQIALLVSTRLVKICHQLDVTGQGYI